MATTFLKRSTLAQLLKRLQEEETEESGRVLSVVKAVNEAGEEGNLYESRLQRPDEEPRTLAMLLLKGETPEEQRAEMAPVLKAGNAPLDYTIVAVQEEGEEAKDVSVLFYWPDEGKWARSLVTVTAGMQGVARSIPWAEGVPSALSFAGLQKGALASFKHPSGGADVVAAITDADIDTDGPGGSKRKDPWWSPNTSLRHPGGASCDSRIFRGVVTPPALRKEYGIAIGDLAWVSRGNKEFAAQVYDSGPGKKIGEISFGLAVDLGIYQDRSEQTEEKAAKGGNNVKDLVTVFFPGSGNGKALESDAMTAAAQACLQQWLGTMPAAEKALFTVAASDWETFFKSLGLPDFIKAHEVMVKTENSPNTPPARELWGNIAPTLAVLAKIREKFNQPLIFHSTYRSLAYNATLDGAAKRSQHLAFRAVDFHIKNVKHSEVAKFARSLRGSTQKVALTGLQVTNTVQGMTDAPPLALEALKLRPSDGGGTEFTFHGGVAEYSTFVHIDCRGADSDWG